MLVSCSLLAKAGRRGKLVKFRSQGSDTGPSPRDSSRDKNTGTKGTPTRLRMGCVATSASVFVSITIHFCLNLCIQHICTDVCVYHTTLNPYK